MIAIVQARMGSSRLPGKVMAPLGELPLIEVLLRRLSQTPALTAIVLATSSDSRNDPLVRHVEQLGYHVFRGDEHDVLGRFYHAAKTFTPDYVIRITGDCPLVDPSIVTMVLDACMQPSIDYASNIDPPTYPDGLDVEVCTWRALQSAHKNAVTAFDREHVTPYLRVPGRFHSVNVRHSVDLSALRWTVDEAIDLRVIRSVLRHFYPRLNFSWLEALNWLESNAALANLNKSIKRNSGGGGDASARRVLIRPATIADSLILHKWRNDDLMRQNSFNSDTVALSTHHSWLKGVLEKESVWLFVAELADGSPVGFIRFENTVENDAEISVTVDAGLRGQGLGAQVVRYGIQALASTRGDLEPVAIVKKNNISSVKCFKSVGFTIMEERKIKDTSAYVLRYRSRIPIDDGEDG